jgi:EAL domain-containing protein (putative c-di-GMP-specific phosphodiesterase class I)
VQGTRTKRGRFREEVDRALANGEFELYFQPAACIASGCIDSLEALVRWRHPADGLLAPSVFLDGIERSPQAWLFTRHVLESALVQAREWLERGHNCRVAVNVSAQLVNRTLANEIADLVEELEVPARMLVLEVTESAVMDDPVAATRALDSLAQFGIGGVAIDDFGTGHSSLGRLRDLPINALKIDRSFIAELDRGVDPAFVRSVIDLAHYLDLVVIGEGVEDEETWRALAQLGCDAAQGYWLSHPLPASNVVDWLDKHDVARLATVGVVGERRHGSGRRALDRIAGAFDRAPEPMLLSDKGHRWAAMNHAARTLLRAHKSALLERRVDDTARGDDGAGLASLLTTVAAGDTVSGTCSLTLGDGSSHRLRYDLQRSFVPHYHVWVLASAE